MLAYQTDEGFGHSLAEVVHQDAGAVPRLEVGVARLEEIPGLKKMLISYHTLLLIRFVISIIN
jgi:hypothetical protein